MTKIASKISKVGIRNTARMRQTTCILFFWGARSKWNAMDAKLQLHAVDLSKRQKNRKKKNSISKEKKEEETPEKEKQKKESKKRETFLFPFLFDLNVWKMRHRKLFFYLMLWGFIPVQLPFFSQLERTLATLWKNTKLHRMEDNPFNFNFFPV